MTSRSPSRRNRASRYTEQDERGRDDDFRRKRTRDGVEEKASEMRHAGYDRRRDADRSRTSRDTGSRRNKDGQDDRRRDHDRDLQTHNRAGPSRRSASPRPRSSRPRSRSHSDVRSQSPEDKAKPNFAPSGLLAADTKTVKNVDGTSTVLKYHEPPEARKPTSGWRLYVFKGKEQVDLLHIQRQSAYLIGRDRAVADIAIEHPSCSKQHAVIQFRQVREKNEFGDGKNIVKPFIIDLESTNGTHVNDEAIPVSRYYELKLGDVIKFGESAREYVILNDDAA